MRAEPLGRGTCHPVADDSRRSIAVLPARHCRWGRGWSRVHGPRARRRRDTLTSLTAAFPSEIDSHARCANIFDCLFRGSLGPVRSNCTIGRRNRAGQGAPVFALSNTFGLARPRKMAERLPRQARDKDDYNDEPWKVEDRGEEPAIAVL